MASSFANANTIWRAGAGLALTGVVTGAFGAHAIKGRYPEERVRAFQTASQYALMNGVALLALSLHPRFATHRFAGPAIAAGTALFSGSIYGLTFARESLGFLGPITPLGGTLIIAGYATLLF